MNVGSGSGLLSHRHFRQVRVDEHQRRFVGRRQRQRVRLHDLFAEHLQRCRLRVVLDEAAHDRGDVGCGVVPLDAGAARRAVGDVADEDQHRHAVGVGVVDAHRGVLQADGVVHDDRHRFAGHLRVAVSHRGGDLFVHAREQLGLAVAAVVDDRFVNAAERGARHARDVVEADVFEHVDHVVGAGVLNVPAIDFVRRVCRFGGDQPRRRAARVFRRPGGRCAGAAAAGVGATPAAAAPAPAVAIPARNARRSTPAFSWPLCTSSHLGRQCL